MSPSHLAVRLFRSSQLSAQVPYAHAATTDAPARLVFTAGPAPSMWKGEPSQLATLSARPNKS
jgi:hypothetical protein